MGYKGKFIRILQYSFLTKRGKELLIILINYITYNICYQVQIALLGLLIISQGDFILGSFLIAEEEKAKGVVGYNGRVTPLTVERHPFKKYITSNCKRIS